MTVVIQRIQKAAVNADGTPSGEAEKGLLLLIGVRKGDTVEICEKSVQKIAKMRIFEDEQGKMNLSVQDIGGSVLAVSNFTLCASCRHGNRPDFFGAERPEVANRLYEHFVETLRRLGISTQTGVFGADMQIDAKLDGPVTIVFDSDKDLSGK